MGLVIAGEAESFFAVDGGEDVEAAALEAAGEHVAVHFVVFDKENGGHFEISREART
jgi:hypothetical protein